VDWDKEAAKLALPQNEYYKEIKRIPVPELVKEFADSAPPDVQDAVRITIAKLLGNMPTEVAAITRVTTNQNIASLMFSMQMTGYMFRNAQYRKSLLDSLESAEDRGQAAQLALPSVSGKIIVEIGPEMKAEVDAAAYMAELRSEVEGLRAQLVAAQEAQANSTSNLVAYVSQLAPEEVQTLTSEISKEVLDAMGQLITSILRDADVQPDAMMSASDGKMRELLVWQLVTGYKLREMEVKRELKDKFWGAEVPDKS
jgi:hypothetical protein